MHQGKAESEILAAHSKNILSLAFSRDGQMLAYGSEDGIIRLKTFSNPARHIKLTSKQKSIFDLALNVEKTRLASAGADGSVLLWDLSQPIPESTSLFKQNSRIRALIFIPKKQILFIGSEDGKLQQWRFRDKIKQSRVLQTIQAHKGAIHSLAINQSGNTLATCGSDATVKLWSINGSDGKVRSIKELYGHEGPVNSVAFHPRDQMLASGSSDKTVRLWDLQNLNNIPIVLSGHDRWVLSIAFIASGDTLIAGTGNSTIYVWPTTAKLLADQVCERATRNLTWEEWRNYVGESIDYECTCKNLPPAPDLPDSLRNILEKNK